MKRISTIAALREVVDAARNASPTVRFENEFSYKKKTSARRKK